MNFKGCSIDFLEKRKGILINEIRQIESDILTFPVTTHLGIVSLTMMKRKAQKELQKINDELKSRKEEVVNEN